MSAPAADPQALRRAAFLLYLYENEDSARDAAYLTGWLRLGDAERSKAIQDCVLTAFLSLFLTFMVLLLPFTIIDTVRELRRIRDKRLLVSDGRLCDGEVESCRGRRARGPHEDSDYYYEVAVRYSFRTPDGLRLTGEAEAARDDLRKAELPPPGTPVRVLYLTDTNYQLL